ncbi:MAG: hypothetical protein SGJ09_05550 [Phycisphaerae bacterium]|nr:hypothetical protein [Phycisphaerae bacterium]
MSSEAAIALALFLGFVGFAVFAIGIVGRHATGEPRCARCRADVRPVAWDEVPRCPQCAADLSRGGSVRLAGRRRRRPELITGALLLALATALWRVDAWLAARELLWRDLRPVGMETSFLGRPTFDEIGAMSSLSRRAKARMLSARDRRAILTLPSAKTLWVQLRLQLANDPSLGDLWPGVVNGLATSSGVPVISPWNSSVEKGEAVRFTVLHPTIAGPGFPWVPIVDRLRVNGVDLSFERQPNNDVVTRIPDSIASGSVIVTCDCRIAVALFGDAAALQNELTTADGTQLPASSLGFPCDVANFTITFQTTVRERVAPAKDGGR